DCSKEVFFCHFVPCLKLDEWLTKKQKPSVFLVRSVAQSGSAPASGAGQSNTRIPCIKDLVQTISTFVKA
ncbi:MAG: hypothetical protein K8F90_04105, partial [Hyphomicrobiales bacterium]|nr:hypothetical protein [Hyphomicrobiales bacterium]